MLLVDAYEPIVVPRLHVLLPGVHIPCSVQHQFLHTTRRHAYVHGPPIDFNGETRIKNSSTTKVKGKSG